MRILLIPLLLSLGACNALQGANLGVLNDVAAKGQAVGEKALDGAAKALDTYCGVTPDSIRGWFRDEVNKRTKKFDAADICQPKPGA